MSNWYKKSWNHGIPLMDEYSNSYHPPSSNYKKDPRSLVNAKPQFGGEKRRGYPENYQFQKDQTQNHIPALPGENP